MATKEEIRAFLRADFPQAKLTVCQSGTVLLLEDGGAIVAFFAHVLYANSPRLIGPAVRYDSESDMREWRNEYREMKLLDTNNTANLALQTDRAARGG